MILVADSHISPARGNEGEFREMLAAISGTSEDVVFLGDIFEFWIALPGYETDMHREFVAWCTEERDRRSIGFVEGNHEFFLAHSHPDAFTFCSTEAYVDGEANLFVHGDTVKRWDIAYRLLRTATKCSLIRWLEATVPIGPTIARAIKQYFERRAFGRQRVFPRKAIEAFAAARFSQGVRTIWMGHFHQSHAIEGAGGRRCEIVPAWNETGMVVITGADGHRGEARHWRDLAETP